MFTPTPLECLFFFFFFLQRAVYNAFKKSIVGARETEMFFLPANNGFDCLEVNELLGRKYQADKQE